MGQSAQTYEFRTRETILNGRVCTRQVHPKRDTTDRESLVNLIWRIRDGLMPRKKNEGGAGRANGQTPTIIFTTYPAGGSDDSSSFACD